MVIAAAAVLSFSALRDLAIAVRIPEQLAWLLPVAVDAGAAVSCATWLSRRVHADASRFAAWMTWALLVLTVVGNAAQLGMHANGITPPWWVAVLVGAVPPAVVGGCVHLAVLVSRGDAPRPPASVVEPEPGDQVATTGDDPGEPLEMRAAVLVAEGAGRKTLARELDVTEHHARQLLERVRQPATNGAVTR